ncbi:hypothetical protein H8356DRAFT_1357806 [Neocallimastix lanati (nom. inval.)]|nr:hypothetical protein H8356DRAFT_1357806 [Neocallimastix sp. JGI-2020a]
MRYFFRRGYTLIFPLANRNQIGFIKLKGIRHEKGLSGIEPNSPLIFFVMFSCLWRKRFTVLGRLSSSDLQSSNFFQNCFRNQNLAVALDTKDRLWILNDARVNCSTGSITNLLVVRSIRQIKGVDYTYTYSPSIEMNYFRPTIVIESIYKCNNNNNNNSNNNNNNNNNSNNNNNNNSNNNNNNNNSNNNNNNNSN